MQTGITGLILAGGRGSRMGNVDKGLQPLQNLPMACHVMRRLAPQVDTLLINANRNLAAYASLGATVVQDVAPDFAGPLAGLQAGLMHCATPLMAVAPCDSPFLPENLVARLHQALINHHADLAVAATGAGDTYRCHPVFCLLKTALLPQLAAYLDGGGRKLAAWQAMVNTVEVVFDDELAFRNINTLEELRNAGHE